MKFMPYQLSTAGPGVIAFQLGGPRGTSLAEVRALIGQQPGGVQILLHFPWYGLYDVAERAAALQAEIGDRAGLHLMANTAAEADGFRRYGLPVLHAPAALFVCEHIFDIQPEIAKTHDAIYVGHFRPGQPRDVKRQQLARLVRSLRMVTYPVTLELAEGEYGDAFRRTFPELSHAEVNDGRLAPTAVAEALNAARVHLALSAVEGCMYAFTEGLLCGVPAVSTPCRGGREQFFHPRHALVVGAIPQWVAAGVATVAAQEPDRVAIRRRALERLRAMRRRYVEYVAQLVGGQPSAYDSRLFDDPAGPDRLCFDFIRPTAGELDAERARHG